MIPGIIITCIPGTLFYHFCSINTIKLMRASGLMMFFYVVSLLHLWFLSCPSYGPNATGTQWLICVRGEGLTDWSIALGSAIS